MGQGSLYFFLDKCIKTYILHFRGRIRSCVNALLFHYTFLLKTYIYMMPHLPPSWCSSNFQVQCSDHCNPIGHTSIACIFSSMPRIRKLCSCSKCISWNLHPAMARVDVPSLNLWLVHHLHVYAKLHCMIQSAFQLLSQHQPCTPFFEIEYLLAFSFRLVQAVVFS